MKNAGNRNGGKGSGLIGFVVASVVAVLIVIVAVVAFYEGRKAYWDAQIRTLCAKDGGFTIFERVTLSKEEYERLGGYAGDIRIPFVGKDPKGSPYVLEILRTPLRKGEEPYVARNETLIRRRVDGKLLSRGVEYLRRGGDLPMGLFHPSSFSCPRAFFTLSKETFSVRGMEK
jgi:hypothetical protein